MALAFLLRRVDCVEKLGMNDASLINTEKKTAEIYHGLRTITNNEIGIFYFKYYFHEGKRN